MIRYEIYSNVANSDHGLQRFPALGNLIHSLATREIDTRIIRQTFREEEEINLASSRHAKGVKVRGTSTREVPVESHIKGCLRWMRTVATRADRGLHLEVENVRATNGAPLVFGQLFAREQQVFVSGVDDEGWARLTAQVDMACKNIPKTIQASKSLREDYLARATRPTGFMTMLQRVMDMGMVSREHLEPVREILAKRDPSNLKTLSEAQIVNFGLIHDFIERYEKLIDQFCALLVADSALGDLPQMFELLTQGLPFDFLAKNLQDFALEEKKSAIRNKRSLVNELRIGLNRGEEERRIEFQRRFMPFVLKARLRQDPAMYLKATRLQEVDPAVHEAMEVPRQLFSKWMDEGGRKVVSQGDSEARLPPDIAQGLFELAVTLIFQAKFAQSFREDTLPPSVLSARNILSCIVLESFDLKSIRKLHPSLPPKGIARNLAGKVPVTHGEIAAIQESLEAILFPMGKLAGELSRFILGKYKDQEAQERSREIELFLQGASTLLDTMNYVVGRSGQTHLIRRAALAAGEMMGLVMLDSRDKIRDRATTPSQHGEDEEHLAGYQLLMVHDESRYFPLKAKPGHVAAAFSHLMEQRIAQTVRRLVSKKLKYLSDLHGAGLFRIIHDHLQWQHRIFVSEDQLASVLQKKGIFDQARLKDFGYRGKSESTGQGENPWYAQALETAGQEPLSRFGSEQANKEVLDAEKALKEVAGRYPARARNGGESSAHRLMARLIGHEMFDPRSPSCAEALEKSSEAGVLTAILEEIITQEKDRLLADGEFNEAIELPMPGPLAYLTLIKESHGIELEGDPVLVRLKPARFLPPQLVDERSMVVAEQLKTALNTRPDAKNLRHFMQQLKEHDDAWNRLVGAMTVPLIDQMLQEIVLKQVRPQPPLPTDLATFPEDDILCLSSSSFDQAKFSKIVAHPERRDVYATLSELASWLHRFRRLEEELDYYRELVGDVLEIIASLNLSAFDAPYITRYGQRLGELRGRLNIQSEEFTAEDLKAVETLSRTIAKLVREGYDQERTVALKDRWLSRIAMRLRSMHPNLRLTFVNRLFEQVHPALRSSGEKGESVEAQQELAKREEYQTFSERVRNVIEYRERLEKKRIIVMAPGNTQRQLTMTLLDQLHRLKGVHTPIFADISGCAGFVDQLRTRIPPYRLFNMNAL